MFGEEEKMVWGWIRSRKKSLGGDGHNPGQMVTATRVDVMASGRKLSELRYILKVELSTLGDGLDVQCGRKGSRKSQTSA